MKLIDILTTLAVIGAIASCSCSDPSVKHEATEPDSLPIEANADTICFRSGHEQSISYDVPIDSDTAFVNSIAWYVDLNGTRYKISKRVYQLLQEYYTDTPVRYDFEGIIVGDSIEMHVAKSSLLIDDLGSSYCKELLLCI